ncbi:SOS response-associated peptidase [Hyphomicrobium sp.]|uniref:SOS response-associated peptidase n=1 Tax=Hyphomicrobium sp. TaxID=82 RepID=UPI0025BFD74E|nr:SOS response-associated peptidase [Hyphomicrobium sp.]MCC7253042.1 SOS response-associated peptidase [Hyphomicrobium sp.]
MCGGTTARPANAFWSFASTRKAGSGRWIISPEAHPQLGEGGGRKPINAKAETIASLPSFRNAYKKRRCLLPIDNFFEWKGTKGSKQPYAVGMKTGEPFALAAILENWKRPGGEDWLRTFAVITTNANELMSGIHDRMPVIIPPIAYNR